MRQTVAGPARRVLVCDDDPAARFVAKRWLTSALGCTVVECEDGVSALEILSGQAFDLAIIDLELPRLGGVEVVEVLRGHEDTRRLPLVILSQERREDVVRALVPLGVEAYLLKPLRESTVLGRIGPLLARRPAMLSQPGGAHASGILLGPETPALLVDGDLNFRHTFCTVASQFAPVRVAESGAAAISLLRAAPAQFVFVGTGLGLVNAESLVNKIRASAASPVRVICVDPRATPATLAVCDGAIPRSFVPEQLAEALRPFVRVSDGPTGLDGLDGLAPGFRALFDSAVTQILGMMAGLDAVPVADGPDVDGPAVVAHVTVVVGARYRVDLDLVLPGPVVDDVSARLLACDIQALDDDARRSTVAELANMITGRFDAWLKAQGIQSQCSLPDVRATADGTRGARLPANGFGLCHALPALASHVALRGVVCAVPADELGPLPLAR